jgi:hypothetical protein
MYFATSGKNHNKEYEPINKPINRFDVTNPMTLPQSQPTESTTAAPNSDNNKANIFGAPQNRN